MPEKGERKRRTRRSAGRFTLESLEARLALDAGAADEITFARDLVDVGPQPPAADAPPGDESIDPTFVPTPVDPPGGDGTVVGQATLNARDDILYDVYIGEANTVDVLWNDSLPVGDVARVASIAAIPDGISVSISADGRSLVVEPSATASGKFDFTYNVTTESGKQGSALVTIHVRPRVILVGPRSDWHSVLEDTTDNVIYVLQNDNSYSDGEIVSVSGGHEGSTIAVANGGKHIVYTPAPGIRSDGFSYEVRHVNGEFQSASVYVQVMARLQIRSDRYELDRDSQAFVLDALANDDIREPALPPRIAAVGESRFGSRFEINADGRTLTYRPAAGFVGQETLSFTVEYGPEAHHVASGNVRVNVIEPLMAVDDWFFVPVGSENGSAGVVLDVLANDLNRAGYGNLSGGHRRLSITDVSQGDAGGQLTIDAAGRVVYSPEAGFIGTESFSYSVSDGRGNENQARATVEVGEPIAAIGDRPRFRGDDELTQYLLENSIRRWQHLFGQWQIRHIYPPTSTPPDQYVATNGNMVTFASTSRDHSSTNTQVAGIDEADVVETDGDFVYAIMRDELLIVDVRNLDGPRLASAMRLSFGVSEMYLMGDRLVLVNRGRYGQDAALLTLDVGDRANPTLLSRVGIDGRIVDTRAIGDDVYFVADANVSTPQPKSVRVEILSDGDANAVVEELWRYETIEEFTARARTEIIASSMPRMSIYDAAGELIETRDLVSGGRIHKPVDGTPQRLTAVGVLGAADDATNGGTQSVDTVGLMAHRLEQIYMSPSGVYVLESPRYVDRDDGFRSLETPILQFSVEGDGGSHDGGLHLAAAGSVRGEALNQFAVDEHNGYLRVATTERVLERWPSWRSVRTDNHVFVLARQGGSLELVGSAEHLVPTQHVRSVRFIGEAAYVSTFREVDPLLSIDLSDPTEPRLRGMLLVPGFSDYLHPVGDDFLIAFGRDGEGANGQSAAPQVSLFHVGDLDNPRLVDRLTMMGASRTFSEAFDDHHAVAYFAEYGVLSLPINWYAGGELRSAAWVFDVDVDATTGTETLDFAGRIDHDYVVRRSLRIEDALVTVSAGELKVHAIRDATVERGRLYLGPPLVGDAFAVDEDSGATVLDVLANDHLDADAEIAAVGYEGDAGRFNIADDGRSLTFTPAEDFFGVIRATYAVDVPGRGRHEASIAVSVRGVDDAPRPADDEFDVVAGEDEVALDVLRNDIDPDARGRIYPVFGGGIISITDVAILGGEPRILTPASANVVDGLRLTGDVASHVSDESETIIVASLANYDPIPWPRVGLTIAEVGSASHGGEVTIAESGGKLLYTPAEGFVGTETFSYVVRSSNGLTAEATVTVHVGKPAAENDHPAAAEPAIRASAAQRFRQRARDVAEDGGAQALGTGVDVQRIRRIARPAHLAARDAAIVAMSGTRTTSQARRVSRSTVTAAPPRIAPPPIAPLVTAVRPADG